MLWEWFVESLRTAIFASSQVCGGNIAGGILIVSVCVRLALFPLTLRLAKLSARHQAVLAKLKPELERLRKRYQDQPERLTEETQRLFQREGTSPLPLAGCLGAVAQMPVFLGLFSAVRKCAALGGKFFWVQNIARPDAILALLVAAATCGAVAVTRTTPEQNKALLLLLPAVMTIVALWQLSAGVALYWGVSSLFSVLQATIVRRTEPAA
jgi:YidC/Oxa1 family membrane protein insertase